MRALVSVIVPVYNTEKYLTKCLESIIGQTLNQIEIILVDDGSTDSSGKICDLYKCKDERIRVLHKKNGGLISARKAGLLEASGEYIGFVDSDDWIESDMYEKMYQDAKDKAVDIILDGIIEDKNGKYQYILNKFEAGVYNKEEMQLKIYPYMINFRNFFSLGIYPYLVSKLFHRSLFDDYIKTINEKITVGEDGALFYPVMLLADKIKITNNCKYHYCIRYDSMMGNVRNIEIELENARFLHEYIYQRANAYGGLQVMLGQLKRYSMNHILTRAYESVASFNKENILFPFNVLRRGSSIILYGAGNFGREVYRYLKKIREYEIVGWTDKEAIAYRELGLPVENLDDVELNRDCYFLVAVMDEAATAAIKETLQSKGVQPSRIIDIFITEKMIDDVLTLNGFCI